MNIRMYDSMKNHGVLEYTSYQDVLYTYVVVLKLAIN